MINRSAGSAAPSKIPQPRLFEKTLQLKSSPRGEGSGGTATALLKATSSLQLSDTAARLIYVYGNGGGHLWPCAAPSLVSFSFSCLSEKPVPFPRNRLLRKGAMGLQSYSRLL